MRKPSFIAYHGSQSLDCGDLSDEFEGRWGAMFFSFDPSMAREFSKGSGMEHICTYEIPHEVSTIFNPENKEAVERLRECLRAYLGALTDKTIREIEAYDWAAFNPAGWIGQEVKACLLSMGYVGWFEKEHGDDRLNFGLYSPEGIRLLNVEYFCDECDQTLSKNEDYTLDCTDCNLKKCVECGDDLEWDDEYAEWIWTCACEDRREFERKRENPWVRDRLYFRCGFWDLEPNANALYHVTPKLSAILDSAELSSRASRKSRAEGLGGCHEVSVSYYGSMERAAFTLVYLYRVWQVKKGILTLNDLANIAGWDSGFVARIKHYQPHELIRSVGISLGAPDPIVLGSDWAEGITKDDFAILEFKNPCKHLFVENLLKLNKLREEPTIWPLTQPSIHRLREEVGNYCYFGQNSEGLTGMYASVRRLLCYGESQITYEGRSGSRDTFREQFIGPPSSYPRDWYRKDVIQYENITLDLRKQPVRIEDLCIYRQGEQEFQLFRAMPMSDLLYLHTMDEVLEIAREYNSGVEPFFWDTKFQFDLGRGFHKFQLATWVDKLRPVGDTLCTRIKSLTPDICAVGQKEYDDWDEFEYGGGGISHLIADSIVAYLDGHGIKAMAFSAQVGDVHVFTIAYDENTREACEINIPSRIYSMGSGYSRSKFKGVEFKPYHIYIAPIDFDEVEDLTIQ